MSRDYNLSSLTPDSTLLYFLRTLFGSAAEYAVYIPDSGDVIVLNKGQLVFLVERGCADAMIKTLPQLASRNIIRPVNPEEIEYPEEIRALYVETTGSFISSLEIALYPDEPQYPEWWNAPVPFALSSRGVLRLNDMAVKMFGNGLERMNAKELPERDEFIVRLDGLNGTRFIAFRKLKPGIFTIDDCTDDLNDAQDITWWAAVGQTWVKEIESQGGKWERLNNPPEGKSKSFRACEWQGQLQGYLNINMPRKKKTAVKKIESPAPDPEIELEPEIKHEDIQPEEVMTRRPDDVVSSIGPQAMALLAAGQSRENI
ncbi:MAG: hypothetical protein IJG34_06270 [Synergistaceae bacterium]|nr:hypothetical protein [Synergistaceae bacterium]MBQ3449481.1 hypothetical protein [Synergistaceae bacterium]MBQ3693867.1 hypothetical protein [Synergistaceae bacterium]MBQ9629565.1 hypothetical protein [Synergistaceae bacterium]MBR0250921.1 hypothetical protein [Synergistaceae bacterium]